MNNQKQVLTGRVVIQLLLLVVGIPFLPLLISQRWDWWEAWAYALIYILGFAASRMLAARRNPDLIAERAHSLEHENTQSWDKVLAPLVGLGGGLLPLIAGLDARFGWSGEFSLPVKILALAVILAGFAFGSYALIENRFFSGTVRIQAERDHRVISSGPYRWLRHPGYAGALWSYLVTPLFLDSVWAFIPAVILTIALFIRTRLEDQFLQKELKGYREYARRVRYRLLPGIW